MQLTNKELKDIKGGASLGTVLIVIGGIIFVIGVIDGYVRPLRCN